MAVIEFVVFHPWKAAATLITGVLLGIGVFYAYQLSALLGAVATEDFNPALARAAIGGADPDTLTDVTFVEPSEFEVVGIDVQDLAAEQAELAEAINLHEPFDPVKFSPYSFGEAIPDSLFEAYLLIGTDASGFRADAIILALQPSDGDAPIMVSLPRDLYVWNACKRTFTRLNAGLGGCAGVASGSEMMAILVEDYTGIPIDHLARIDFGGFERVVDTMGGTTICVDYPTRDAKSGLNITEPGCHDADGALTLAWVRSRGAEQLIEGEWVRVTGSDYTRQERQQDVLFQLAANAAGFPSPASLTSRLNAVASSLRLDSAWTFGQAISTAWQYRGISRSSVSGFSIAIANYRTPAGAAVLLPTKSFKTQLSNVHSLG